MLKTVRKWHKWPGIVLTFFILVFALSGIILNHRDLLSSVDVKRSWLPKIYSWNNWNLAAVKGSVKTGKDSLMIYGNIGIWSTDTSLTKFSDFNKGFPEGIDNRKVSSVVKTRNGDLYAGTLFGLFSFENGSWQKIKLPVKEERVVRVLEKGDSLLVLTRSNLLLRQSGGNFSVVKLPVPADDDGKAGLFKTLWVLHSGEIYGITGKLIVDIVGFVFIIICITGLIWFFVPLFLKRIKDNAKSRIRKFNRDSLRVHNWLGSWLVPLLLLTTVTGMFLRPPLLIPIASSRVDKIKFTEIDNPNPWFDRFRDLVFDKASGRYYFATGDRIYYSDDELKKPLQPCGVQPPVSVMGITSFEKYSDSAFIVGSFSGIYLWNPETGEITDHFTGMAYEDTGNSGAPFGNLSVSGYIRINQKEYIFDYAAGAIGLKDTPAFAEMPDVIKQQSQISLWNTALEIHTGRIYEPLLGKMYILVVPLTGIFTLVIIISGFLSWYIARRNRIRALKKEMIPE